MLQLEMKKDDPLQNHVIIEKTLKLQSQLDKQGTFFSFSMNLSGKEIGDKELLEFLRSKTTEIGVDPKRLIFEITETAAIRELEQYRRIYP